MGRWTSGDIEHKFWLGIQSSDAASQYGGESEVDCSPLDYYVMEEFDIKQLDINIALFNIKCNENVDRSTDPQWFYDWINSKTPSEQKKYNEENITKLAADTQLGLKIFKCIIEKGECFFTSEY